MESTTPVPDPPAGPPAGRIVDAVYYPPLEAREILWEVPGRAGRIRRLWQTWKFAIAQPSSFFSVMRPDAGIHRAFTFAVVFVALGQVAAMAHGGMIGEGMLDWLGDFWTSQELPLEDFERLRSLLRAMFAGQFLTLPVAIVSALTVMLTHTALYWLAAWLMGGAPFGGLLKITCYAQATHLFSLVPFVGCACVQPLYYMFVCFMGFRYAAGLSTARSLFVVFFPLLTLIFLTAGPLFDMLFLQVLMNLFI